MNTKKFIQDRIIELMEAKNLNKNSFSVKIGVSNVVVGHIVGGRRSEPSFPVLVKIIQAFDSINLHWLILGEGEMFTQPAPEKGGKQTETDLRDLVASQKKTIAMLEECISKIPQPPQGAPKNKVKKVVKTEKG